MNEGMISSSLPAGAVKVTPYPANDRFLLASEPALALMVVKRCFDVLGASLLLMFLSPLFLLLSLIIRGASGGSPIFAQPRIGRNGQQFTCYKFRTMIVNADQVLASLLQTDEALRKEWGNSQKLRQDPRITPIGFFLRRTSLDELPQLFNVLLGDMSLVGPRPVLPEQVIYYGRSARWYYAMRPGMTGLWQVTARGDKDFRRRVTLDCFYVRHFSLRRDLLILIKTVGVVMTGRGAY